MDACPSPSTRYRTANIDGLDVFYREAGDRSNPTLLLLHGFPSSSHMFRNLINSLSDSFHLVAPGSHRLRALVDAFGQPVHLQF